MRRSILLFCEDSFHEKFIAALIRRFNQDYGLNATVNSYSARGGLPRVKIEFQTFLKDLSRQTDVAPDWIVVVTDANCLGFNERKKQLESALVSYPSFEHLVSYVIPDPHIERWMLVDPAAFKDVFGRGCTLPVVKCAKDEYKKLLLAEIKKGGIDPPLGGEEYAEDIVAAMDLAKAEIEEPSLGLFLKALKGKFNAWK